jgi:hypothetical protein
VIEIRHMNSAYRLAGTPERRGDLSRRLDRIVCDRIGAELETAASAFAAADGPVYRIRRLDLTMWLNTAVNDAGIARGWAATLARALYRTIADAGSGEVIRYNSPADYLACWVADFSDQGSQGRWEYDGFGHLDGVRTGQAISFVLARDQRWILPVFAALRTARRSEAVIETLQSTDVEVLWTALAGTPPAAPVRIDSSLVERARRARVTPPAFETGRGADARAHEPRCVGY